jgi:hypothetical protein
MSLISLAFSERHPYDLTVQKKTRERERESVCERESERDGNLSKSFFGAKNRRRGGAAEKSARPQKNRPPPI